MTITLIDELRVKVATGELEDLTMSQLLQHATWIMGRELAFKRDSLGRPPLNIKVDENSGLLF